MKWEPGAARCSLLCYDIQPTGEVQTTFFWTMPCFATHKVPSAYDLTVSCLLLPKVLRGRTVPRQNHEVGETCIHSLLLCNDCLILDSFDLPVPRCQSGSLLWIYNLFSRRLIVFFVVQSLFDRIVFSLKRCWVASQKTADNQDSPSFPLDPYFSLLPSNVRVQVAYHLALFIYTLFPPCYSFCPSRPLSLISIHENPDHVSRLHSAPPPSSTFPNRPQPLFSTPHLYHSHDP